MKKAKDDSVLRAEKMVEIATEISGILDKLKGDYEVKDGHFLSEFLKRLIGYLSRTTELLPEAKYILNIEKGLASEEIMKAYPGINATRYRDILDMRTAPALKVVNLVDRTNATLTHTIDAVRSQLSYVKSEAALTGGSGREAN